MITTIKNKLFPLYLTIYAHSWEISPLTWCHHQKSHRWDPSLQFSQNDQFGHIQTKKITKSVPFEQKFFCSSQFLSVTSFSFPLCPSRGALCYLHHKYCYIWKGQLKRDTFPPQLAVQHHIKLQTISEGNGSKSEINTATCVKCVNSAHDTEQTKNAHMTNTKLQNSRSLGGKVLRKNIY